MKKILSFVILLLLIFTFSSCKGEDKVPNEVIAFENDFQTMVEKKDDTHLVKEDVSFDYSNFNESSENENKNILYFSYLLSWSTETHATKINGKYDYSKGYLNLENYFNKLKLEDLYFNDDYKIRPTSETIGFGIGTKSFENSNNKIVIVVIRGQGYNHEWESNIDVGVDGEHKGFSTAGEKVYKGIKEYLNKFDDKANIKLLVTGYSRAGATANQVGRLFNKELKDGTFTKVKKTNFYAYSFNCPQSSVEENDLTLYSNMYVYYSDIIYHLLPHFGFHSLGKEKKVTYEGFKDDFNKEYKGEFDSFKAAKLSFVPFGIKEVESDIKDFDSFYDKAFNMLYFSSDDSSVFTVDTRKKYNDNLKDALTYLMHLMFDVDQNYLIAFNNIDVLKDIGISNILRLFEKDSEVVYEIVKKQFDKNNLTYDDEKLKNMCNSFQSYVYSLYVKFQIDIVDVFASFAYNMKAIVAHHSLEGFNMMIKNYIKNN